MIDDLFNVISERIQATTTLNVGHGLSSDRPALPTADIWLADDDEIVEKPGVIRELVWMVMVTVGHNDTVGASQSEIHGHLDAIRDAFAGWRPSDCAGIKDGFSVPKIKILSYQDHGSAVYLVSLVIRVFPKIFARTI